MKIREDYICPIEVVTDMLRGKWKTIILWRLRLGPTSLSQLYRDIENVSEKMLLQQLAELIECGFVAKTEFPGYPLKVTYSLNDELGMELLKALTILQEIGSTLTGNKGCER